MESIKKKSINEIIQSRDPSEIPHCKNMILNLNFMNCSCQKVLIVDDIPTNILVLETFIKATNIQCDKAMNGIEAIEAIQKRLNLNCCGYYSLILMDISMPFMDGFQATKIIRSKEMSLNKTSVPIVACSANEIDQENLIIEYLKNGFNDISFLT